jgi:thiol peroxidase
MVKFKGEEVQLPEGFPKVGEKLADFILTDNGLAKHSLADFAGKKIILNIFPSVDTGVCAASVRAFNKKAADLEGTKVLCISEDLPFAHQRFCGAEGIENVVSLSAYQDRDFGERYGLRMKSTALSGLLARAVIVADEEGVVRYTELVPDIAQEPDYQGALAAL